MRQQSTSTLVAALVLAGVACGSSTAFAQADAVMMQNIWVSRFSSFRGNLRCNYGDHDCNRCVNNVETQFRNLTQRGAHTARVKQWEWKNEDKLPSGSDPTDILKTSPAAGHFQGFVRIPTESLSDVPNFAASHSNSWDDPGGVFLSRNAVDSAGRAGDGTLKYLYHASLEHPGGMQSVGNYLLIATEPNDSEPALLEVINTPLAPSPRDTYLLPKIGKGAANIAATRLAGGGYLLLAAKSSYHNGYRMFYTPTLDAMQLERAYDLDLYTNWDTGWDNGDGEQVGFESISFVTECGSGKTYMIGSTAADMLVNDVTAAYWGESVWALFEVVPGSRTPMRLVTRNTLDMYSEECDPRAAGSAYAGPKGELGLYCHQKTQNSEARRNKIACGVSAGLAALGAGALVGVAAGFCTAAVSADRQILFTEYWPNVTSDYTVSVTVSGGPTGYESGAVGVLEADTGMICDSRGPKKTCSWKVKAGQSITLIPYGHPDWDVISWEGQCAERNAGSRAVECKRTVNSNLSFELQAVRVI